MALPFINCPHCDSKASIRTSRDITRLHREYYLQCQNVDCGHTFAALFSVDRTLSPSATPRTGINLPFGRRINTTPPAQIPSPANEGAPEIQAEA